MNTGMNLGVESGDIGALMTSRFDDWTVQGPNSGFQKRGATPIYRVFCWETQQLLYKLQLRLSASIVQAALVVNQDID